MHFVYKTLRTYIFQFEMTSTLCRYFHVLYDKPKLFTVNLKHLHIRAKRLQKQAIV